MKKAMNYLTKSEKRAVNEFARLMRAELGERLIRMDIFGSKVKGNFTEDSDIDILIIVKKRTLDVMDMVAGIASELMLKYNLPISPVVFSEYEYKVNANMSSPFILNVESEGIVL